MQKKSILYFRVENVLDSKSPNGQRLAHIVVKTQNTMIYRVGQEVSEREIEELIRLSLFEVIIF